MNSNNNKSGYDEIKNMLKTMRHLNESNSPLKTQITEQTEDSTSSESENTNTEKKYDNVEVINDVEVKLLSTDKEDVELKQVDKDSISQIVDSFRQQISQIAELDPGFTITEKQIRLDGSMIDLDINFVLIAGEESGLYINSEMLSVEKETIDILEKLLKFKPVFISAMEPLIRERMTT